MEGWQIKVLGNTLSITTPVARVEAIQHSLQSWGERIVINLDRPTPWQVTQQYEVGELGGQVGKSIPVSLLPAPLPLISPTQTWKITIDATLKQPPPTTPNPQRQSHTSPTGVATTGGTPTPERLTPGDPALATGSATRSLLNGGNLRTRQAPQVGEPAQGAGSRQSPQRGEPPHGAGSSVGTPSSPPPLISTLNIKATQSQTILQVDVPDGFVPHITTLPNPNQIAIDFRLDAPPLRDILWAPGLRWRQQLVNLDSSRFPVVWLEINLFAPGLKIRPIWSNPNTLIGTAPLIRTAQLYGAAAAINGGFFNRHEQLPLGAIRRDGRWLSSPILNRGAIAWNEFGQVKIGRLSLQETLTTSLGESLPILALNSGYIEAGIARYNSDWGPTYTPLNDNEIIIVVEHQQVTAQFAGGAAGQATFPIPPNGYLLVIRDRSAVAQSLPIGTGVSLDTTTPSDFAPYSQVLGAGPLLIQNQQIVLDAKAEHFSNAFIKETAPRSAICTLAAPGTLLIAAVHNRIGGVGPTLAELALLLQQMGCVDALNLDGGSSTSLYLGGRLLDRSSSTAARVHNGLGVFLEEMK
ncbi:MAG: phosphodiester glycosidase family protein [Chroococcidiopsidaceae cyanobacterium CP_BM_ER_R8_30]|nr:phosphodiester glycosidase family protein [Chroococcidiopsidaceae cyanobacterium CP_BM_ER_R8_30]